MKKKPEDSCIIRHFESYSDLGVEDRDLLRSLEEEPAFRRTPLRLDNALQGDALAIIAEAKKASPSKGVIREAYDPAAIAGAYEKAGASAISVLTEPHHFQGSPQHLADVRAAATAPRPGRPGRPRPARRRPGR